MASHRFVDSSQIEPVPAAPWSDLNFNAWAPGRAMGWHAHAYLQVIHVLEGLLEVDIGTGWKPVRAGHAHVLPPGRSHRLRTIGGQRQFGLNFSATRDERGLLDALLAAFPTPAILALPFAAGWREAMAPGAAHGPLAQLRRCHALEAYGLALLERAAPRPGDDGARRLRDWLHDHADRPLRVTLAARALGMSRTGAQRLCRQRFGCGIAHLHERLRLERAARLLASGDEPIASVAEDCGYADVYGFSRAFRRVHGRPPGAYRRALRSGMG